MAQSGQVTALVVDAETGETVPGAVIEIVSKSNPDHKKYATSGYGGAFQVRGLAYGQYTLSVSFLGYAPTVKEFQVTKATQNLGRIELREEAVEIDAVVKEVQALRTSQKGDTVSYNADAFKVTADADVEGLLKKMPGLTVSDGTVEAQGETVQKVFVDGKEFFGEDVTSAIKSLPAQAVERIEVYNKLSDQAEFSGIDDGESYKAINIVTRENMRQGTFGKVYAGYGYDADTQTEDRNKYVIGGNVNFFSGSKRLSLIGLFNNINQQNFSFEDILGVTGNTGGGHGRFGRGVGQYMVRHQSGVASVNAVGLNYSDTWGSRDQVSFQGSYFFNGTRTIDRSRVERWYEEPAPIDTLYTSGYSRTENFNNRLNARIEWKISDNQSLMIRPGFSFQSNDPFSTTYGRQFGESGYSVIDNFEEAFRHGYSINTSAVYRVRLGKPGRTLTVDGFFNYYDSQRKQNSYSNDFGAYEPYPDIDPDTGLEMRPNDEYLTDLVYQRVLNPSFRYRLNGRINYTEPLSKYSQLSLSYRASYNYQENDRSAYRTGENFNIAGLSPDPLLSNAYRSSYLIHSVGPGFNYSKNKSTFAANVYYQYSTLSGEVIRTGAEPIRHDYDNVTYFLMGQLYLNSQNTLRIFLRSYTDNPKVTQLQNVYDLSDAQYISRGNPLLRPSYTHNLRMHYTNSNVEKGRTFMVMLSAEATQDYISSLTLYRPTLEIENTVYRPLQYMEPCNLDGYWSIRSMASYGFPLNFIKSNLNLRAGVTYSLVPSLVEGEKNKSGNIGYDTGVVLGSNISENIDFTLSWDGLYNEASNSLATVGQKNRYFYQQASANFKFIFGAGFSVSGSASYNQYRGFTNNYNDEYLICNLYVGKKVLRQMGEINIGVNDIFNQNTAFSRTTGSGWTQNSWNSVIGRYYSIQFVYNLRFFGKKGSKNIKDYDGVVEPSRSGSVGMTRGSSPRPGFPPPPRH